MPYQISKRIENYCKKVKCKKILIIGVAYKKNVDDVRESPGLRIIDYLNRQKFDVIYHDPYIKSLPNTREFKIKKRSIKLSKKILSKNIVIIVTDHDKLDYEFIKKNSKFIFDCRGRFKRNYPNKVLQI